MIVLIVLCPHRSAQAFEADWEKVLAARKKEEEGGESKAEGPPILAMAVEPLPDNSQDLKLDTAEERNSSESNRLEGSEGVSPLRVSASAVERVAGDPGEQSEATTSGDASDEKQI